ncbi:hypothetical protein BU198_29200 [Streptomyces sp. CBMA156]|nr:hypothetical protein [Streptomyces sp. CBMA156]
MVFAANPAHVDKPDLTISQSVYDRIVAHVHAGYPAVVCGMGIGPHGSDRASRVLPMTNLVARSPAGHEEESDFSWEMDPRELVPMYREMEASGEELLIVYHSRPDGDALLSRIDIQYGGVGHHFVIVAVDTQGRIEFRSYRITDTRVREEEVRVVPSYDA